MNRLALVAAVAAVPAFTAGWVVGDRREEQPSGLTACQSLSMGLEGAATSITLVRTDQELQHAASAASAVIAPVLKHCLRGVAGYDVSVATLQLAEARTVAAALDVLKGMRRRLPTWHGGPP